MALLAKMVFRISYGQKLKSGAYLNSLIRTKIGEYSIENSMSIEDFQVENHEII